MLPHLILTNAKEVILPLLQMKKMKFWEVKLITHNHPTSNWQAQAQTQSLGHHLPTCTVSHDAMPVFVNCPMIAQW